MNTGFYRTLSALSVTTSALAVEDGKQVLLATVIKVTNNQGEDMLCRALLDSGSQSCFITNSCAKKLGLKQFTTSIPVCDLGGIST